MGFATVATLSDTRLYGIRSIDLNSRIICAVLSNGVANYAPAILDISNFENPYIRGTVAIGSTRTYSTGTVCSLGGNNMAHCYKNIRAGFLNIYNISDKDSPVLSATVALPTYLASYNITNVIYTSSTGTVSCTVPSGHGFITGDTVLIAGLDASYNGTYTLVSYGSTAIRYIKFGLSAPVDKVGTASVYCSPNPIKIVFSGETIYIIKNTINTAGVPAPTTTDFISCIDSSSGNIAAELTSPTTSLSAIDGYVSGNVLFVTGYDSPNNVGYLFIYDISDSLSPALLSTTILGSAPFAGIEKWGSNFLVIGRSAGVFIYDISDLTSPSLYYSGGTGVYNYGINIMDNYMLRDDSATFDLSSLPTSITSIETRTTDSPYGPVLSTISGGDVLVFFVGSSKKFSTYLWGYNTIPVLNTFTTRVSII